MLILSTNISTTDPVRLAGVGSAIANQLNGMVGLGLGAKDRIPDTRMVELEP
jgi:hypothetical protein